MAARFSTFSRDRGQQTENSRRRAMLASIAARACMTHQALICTSPKALIKNDGAVFQAGHPGVRLNMIPWIRIQDFAPHMATPCLLHAGCTRMADGESL